MGPEKSGEIFGIALWSFVCQGVDWGAELCLWLGH